MNWTKVEDGLPEDSRDVLVTDGWEAYDIGFCLSTDKSWDTYGTLNPESITHWAYITPPNN